MKKHKFIIDLGMVELSENQAKEIKSGIEKLVTGILVENEATRHVKLSLITPEMALKLYGLNGGTTGYNGGGGGGNR